MLFYEKNFYSHLPSVAVAAEFLHQGRTSQYGSRHRPLHSSRQILKSEPTIDDNSVQAFVVGGVDMKKLAPEFELTPGATISPESGTERDFTEDQRSAVTPRTSWQKTLQRQAFAQSDMQERELQLRELEKARQLRDSL